MSNPTVNRAFTRVRTDSDARFAALLAAIFAFSLGFLLGFPDRRGWGNDADTDRSAD